MKLRVLALTSSLFLGSAAVHGFELVTHAQLSRAAFDRSNFIAQGRASDLGLSAAEDLGSRYYDIAGTATPYATRHNTSFDDTLLQLAGVTPLFTPADWFMRGAIREDDLSSDGCLLANGFGLCNPLHEDPYGEIDRVLRHFFDPYRNRGLKGIWPRSPDWALGARDAFANPLVTDRDRRNHFTIADARRSMYAALSGRGPAGEVLTKDSRAAFWATTFRSLGGAAHLLQDMAQPEHTRDDAHPGSSFELYVESRARRLSIARPRQPAVPMDPLPLNVTYTLPGATSFASLWSTGLGASSLTGRGLANYSNRGFFTTDTNLDSSGAAAYPSPPNSHAAFQEVTRGSIKLLQGNVIDSITGESTPTLMTGFSAFNRFGPVKKYTMNSLVYEDHVKLLVPRAIGYSTALVDYFFRARIDFTRTPGVVGSYRVKNLGSEPINGTFELFYDDQDEMRKSVIGFDNQPVKWESGGEIAPDAFLDSELNFTIPPDARKPGQYILVFHGHMGQEKRDLDNGYFGAVAAKIVEARKPSSLYLGGVDAQGRLVTMKVDEHGMRVLSGPDGAGFNRFTPFNVTVGPHDDVDPLYELLRVKYQGQPLKVVPRTRQAVFSGGFYPGYETTGISFHRSDSSRALTYLRNPVNGKLVYDESADSAWRATDSNGAIFDFKIELIGGGTSANLRWSRSKPGEPLAAGQVPLPPRPDGASLGYSAFRAGNLLIAPNGLSVKGFYSLPPDDTMSDDELRITLGTPPSVTYFRNPPIARFVSTFGNPAVECLGGYCTTTSSGYSNGISPKTWLGYIDGEPRYWNREEYGEAEHYRLLGSSTLTTVTNSGCPFDVIRFTQAKDESRDRSEGRKTDVLSTGGRYVLTSKTEPSVITRANNLDSRSVEHHLSSGGGGCDSVTVDPPQETRDQHTDSFTGVTSGEYVVQTFSGDAAGTVVASVATGSATYRLGETGINYTGIDVPVFVGDTSPIGEMFIALPDKSFILYRPSANSGMPATLTIPPHVVKLIAAFWM